MRLTHCLGIALLALTLAPAMARAEEFDRGHVHVIKADAPKRLELSVDVPMPRAAVWNLFATEAGMASWVGPKVSVDWRLGGDWLVYYPNGLTGGGTILALQDQRLVAFGALAPDSLPTVRRERTYALFTFDDAARGATRVRMTVTGWKDGAEWEKAFGYLAEGDAQYLEALYARAANGPTDWAKAAH